ncbi:DinB family protein [Flavobacterium hauense]
MIPFFKELFEYTYEFNNKVINALPNNTPHKSIQLINHTVNAQQIWNARINNIKIETGVWDIRPIQELLAINEINYQTSLEIVQNRDFKEKITYTNTKGLSFENSIRDMLFHCINHSTYHRAQIATDFKQHGIEPIVTDYIFYKRTQL